MIELVKAPDFEPDLELPDNEPWAAHMRWIIENQENDKYTK